jgi:hypothetical protein
MGMTLATAWATPRCRVGMTRAGIRKGECDRVGMVALHAGTPREEHDRDNLITRADATRRRPPAPAATKKRRSNPYSTWGINLLYVTA